MKRLLIVLLVLLSFIGVYLAHSTLDQKSTSIDTKTGVTKQMATLPGLGMNPYPTSDPYQQQMGYNPNGIAGLGSNPYTPGLGVNPYTDANPDPNTGITPTQYQTQATAPAPDPYAKWGGQTQFNNLQSGFNTQKQNIYGTANDAAANQGIGLKNNILDFVQGLKTSQRGIDQQAVNNDLAKRQGVSGILGMVGRGIRSSGVTLANKNAGDSSAAGAIADAYGQYGRGQMANIGNQYAQGQNAVNLAQANLGDQQAAGVRKLSDSKTQVVNGIVADARDKFAQLDASMVNASMPDRIAIEQEKENVRQQVLGQLQQYDQLLANETSSIAPTSQDARMTEAARLQNAGTDLGTNAFQYSTQTPTQLQGTGPFASELPLFTYRGNKQLA